MEISIFTSNYHNSDGSANQSIGDGGGSCSHQDKFVKALDNALNQVMGEKEYDHAYTMLTVTARALVELGMQVDLMFKYQDMLAERFAHRNAPVAPVQNIDQYNQVGNNTGPFKGNVSTQNMQLGSGPNNDDSNLLDK